MYHIGHAKYLNITFKVKIKKKGVQVSTKYEQDSDNTEMGKRTKAGIVQVLWQEDFLWN